MGVVVLVVVRGGLARLLDSLSTRMRLASGHLQQTKRGEKITEWFALLLHEPETTYNTRQWRHRRRRERGA